MLKVLVKFKKNEVFRNSLVTHPQNKFFIYDKKIYFNNQIQLSGCFSDNINQSGNLGFYVENTDRKSSLIYPYLVKTSEQSCFKSITQDDYINFSYGDILTGSYVVKAQISRDYYSANAERPYIRTLQNVLNHNSRYSKHYSYSSSYGDKSTQALSVINIPSIFYGSNIKKGSVCLEYFISGTLLAQVRDITQNGTLVQISPSGSAGSGSIAGCVLYNEGFIILTGSWNLSTEFTEPYIPGSAATYPRWLYFGSTGSTGINENLPSSSFALSFDGTSVVPTMTMFCKAGKGRYNNSSNATFVEFGQGSLYTTSSYGYIENDNMPVKNINFVAWESPTGSFERITYISGIGIYDKNRNLIGIARLAKPVRKKETESYIFKIKGDF